MIRTFRANRRLRRELERGLASLDQQLPRKRFAAVSDEALCLSERQSDTSASKPVYEYRDDRGNRYLFKLTGPELAAAEVCADRIRRLGGRPSLPVRVAELVIPDGSRRLGVLKPLLHFDATKQLSPETATWTPLQRATILCEHAWEWYLGNLDTNTSQYALLPTATGELLPLNVDWDRSFAVDASRAPTRFDRYRFSLPNAHTFLYADYVEGRIDLHLDLLLDQAQRIRNLPKAALTRALSDYAEVRFQEDREAQTDWLEQQLDRKRDAPKLFLQFVRYLVEERLENEQGEPRVRAWAWSFRQSQHLLHHLVRGPVGSGARRVLRAVRGAAWFGPWADGRVDAASD